MFRFGVVALHKEMRRHERLETWQRLIVLVALLLQLAAVVTIILQLLDGYFKNALTWLVIYLLVSASACIAFKDNEIAHTANGYRLRFWRKAGKLVGFSIKTAACMPFMVYIWLAESQPLKER